MFEQIESTLQTMANGLVETRALLHSVVQMQGTTQAALASLVQTVDRYTDGADARMKESEQAARRRDEAITRYVEAADARMKRIEENLDALIRAITAEHKNGKGQPGKKK